MENTEWYSVAWKDSEIGKLSQPIPDMWYLEGVFEIKETELAYEFKEIAKKLSAKEIMQNPSKGIMIKLHYQGDKTDTISALVFSLKNDMLFVRRIIEH